MGCSGGEPEELLVLLLPLLMVLLAETGVWGTGLVMRMFSGFTSRCTTPFSWQWRRASNTCLHPARGRRTQELGGLCLARQTRGIGSGNRDQGTAGTRR